MTTSALRARARRWVGRRGRTAVGALAIAGLGAGGLAACQLPGASLVVTTTVDGTDHAPGDGVCETALGTGVCTVRAAVMEANATPGTNNIELGAGTTYVLTLGTAGTTEDAALSGDLDITESVAINGSSTIDAAGIDRVFDVHGGGLILDGPTITGGVVSTGAKVGGGVRVAAGASLLAVHATIDGNEASHGGGGVDSAGPVTLIDSTVSENTTVGQPWDEFWINGSGGGVAVHSAPLTVHESSIVGNTTDEFGTGGGLFADGTGQVTTERSTVSGNRMMATTSAAIASPTTTVRASTIVDNAGGAAISGTTVSLTASTVTSVADAAVDATTGSAAGTILASTADACTAPLVSQGYNVASDATCGLAATGDQFGINPLLGGLADNGGPTATRMPYANSPAVDAIPAGTPVLCDGTVPLDQRGQARPGGSGCDAGAVEGSSTTSADPLDVVVDDPGDAPDLAPGDGACLTPAGTCTLRAALEETNAWTTADAVTIEVGIDPTWQSPTFPAVTDSVSIQGNGATLTAQSVPGGGSNPLTVSTGAVTIDHIRLVSPRGLVVGGGNVTISDSTISASILAGIHVLGGGHLDLVRSTSSANAYGVTVEGATATILQSTLAGNRGAGLTTAPGGSGPVEVVASTVSGPIDGSEAAIRSSGSAGVVLVGSVVSDRSAAPTCTGSVVSGGHNVVDDTSCGIPAAGDQVGVNPLLLPLGDHGGPTATRPPYANSPAVDAIPVGTAGLCDGTFPTDQRGSVRPDGGACDAGAAEGPLTAAPSAPLAMTVTSGADASDLVPGDGNCASTIGPCTLRAAVDESNGWPLADTITVASGVDPTLSIAGRGEDANATGDLDILDGVTIVGSGQTIDAAHLDGVFDHIIGPSTLSSMTVRGGGSDPGSDSAGAIRQRTRVAPLAVHNSVVTANDGDGIASDGPLTVSTSSITANGRNGVYSRAVATIDRSTISGNGRNAVLTWSTLTVTRSTLVASTLPAIDVNTSSHPVVITASTLTSGSTYGTIRTTYRSVAQVRASAVTATAGPTCSGLVVSLGYNRWSGTGCSLHATGDLKVPDLGIGPLGDNGGGTDTFLPNVGGALLDVIPAGTAGLCDGALPTDQRGQPRPQGAGCDVGAVERTP